MNVPVLSFFTGGGLLDLGLEQAGFSVAWTNEANTTIAEMYEFAMTAWRKSLSQEFPPAKISSRENILDLKAVHILDSAFPEEQPEIYGVVGGPPCPDFSNGGTHNGHNGENGKLTETFVEMIMQLQPSFFLIENVAGLYRFRKHRKFLDQMITQLRKDCGYLVDYRLLNALELGVPQNRERLFVIGFPMSLVERALGRDVDLHEIDWFPWPKVSAYTEAKNLNWPTTNPFGNTPNKPTSLPIELTTYSVLAGNGDPEELPNGKEYFNSYSEKFWERYEGDVSSKSFKRLHRFRYSPTAWYGNQEVHLHPWKPRRLSVREALRIQSAPDEYVLPPDKSLSVKFRLICNGVPCRMAELLGIKLKNFLAEGTMNHRIR